MRRTALALWYVVIVFSSGHYREVARFDNWRPAFHLAQELRGLYCPEDEAAAYLTWDYEKWQREHQ